MRKNPGNSERGEFAPETSRKASVSVAGEREESDAGNSNCKIKSNC
jgi:hypothetical protein